MVDEGGGKDGRCGVLYEDDETELGAPGRADDDAEDSSAPLALRCVIVRWRPIPRPLREDTPEFAEE